MNPASAQDQVIRWIDGRVLPLLPGTAPDGMLPSVAGLFLLGSDFRGPIWQAEVRDWLALVVGPASSPSPCVTMNSCQVPGSVQREAANPARSGRKQR